MAVPETMNEIDEICKQSALPPEYADLMLRVIERHMEETNKKLKIPLRVTDFFWAFLEDYFKNVKEAKRLLLDPTMTGVFLRTNISRDKMLNLFNGNLKDKYKAREPGAPPKPKSCLDGMYSTQL